LQGPVQALARAAQACGRRALALPCSIALIDDSAAWLEALQWAKAQGVHGCLCIHPQQVLAANATLGPSPQELAWAQAVLTQAEQHQGSVFRLNGQMVDAPVLTRAQRWLAQSPRASAP
jgi:citrate lyase beta subunit